MLCTPDPALPAATQARQTAGFFASGFWRLLTPVLLLALSLPAAAWDPSQLRAAARRIGPGANAAMAPLSDLLGSATAMGEFERVRAINAFFNERLAWRLDRDIWGVQDRWATPLEALDKGQGDCEDYAIAKYASLLAAGTAPERLRLVYVRAQQPRQPGTQAHMVLAYYASFGAEPLILDNLSPEVLPASRRPDLAPVFSFSAVGLWQAGGGGARASDALRRLSKWRDVWSRTRAEGWP